MLNIFIGVSQPFIESGFSNALIRKKDCTQADYSTVFYDLIAVYFMLFFLSGPISNFYRQPILKPMIQIMGLGLIITSFTIIQSVILVRYIDFKLQAEISFASALFSGIIAIIMAFACAGVWRLVIRIVSAAALGSVLLWMFNKWRPALVFSKSLFKELFGFGNKLLLSSLLDKIYNNVYYLIIGKFFLQKNMGIIQEPTCLRTFLQQT